MDTFLNAGSMMLVLFFTVAIGYLARKIHLVDDSFDDTLSKVVMKITCPAVVLDSVLSNSDLPNNSVVWQILGVSFLLFVPVVLIALLIPRFYRIPDIQKGSHEFTIAFSNVGLVGFAVCDSILGSESVLYLAIYNIACNLVLFSVGAWMIARSGTVKLTKREQLDYVRKNLLSPIMAACVLALIFALFHITDTGVIGKTCELLGAMTPAAAMLIIGSTLAKYEIKSMFNNGWAYITTAARLLLIPTVVYFVGSFFISDPYIVASLVLINAMPAAMMGTTMSIIYGGDSKSLSQGMFLSTIFSVITIPLVTTFLI